MSDNSIFAAAVTRGACHRTTTLGCQAARITQRHPAQRENSCDVTFTNMIQCVIPPRMPNGSTLLQNYRPTESLVIL